MKIPKEEESAFKTLQALAKKDEYVVKHVLSAIYVMIMMKMYDNQDEVVLPLLGKLKFEYDGLDTPKGVAVDLKISIEPSDSLINEFTAYYNKEETPGQKYYRKEIINKMNDALEGDEELREYLLNYFDLDDEESEDE